MIGSMRFPMRHDDVFPHGFLCLGVEALTDFERIGTADPQARTDDGVRIWVAKGYDLDPDAGKFNRSTEVKVKIAAAQQPVLPSSLVPGYPPAVEFVGLEAVPWTDGNKCTGRRQPHQCKARLSWSFWATAIEPAGFESGSVAA